MRPSRWRLAVPAVGGLLLALWGCSGPPPPAGSGSPPPPEPALSRPAAPEAPSTRAAREEERGGTVRLSQLPPEAAAVIESIRRGPPYRYERDGIPFQNRERRLPAKPRGYYREFTVPTPGARDRGARRIIAGDGGELYYTGDHYRSFVEIVR